MGHSVPDIIAGLCQALVRSDPTVSCKGKRKKSIQPPVVFQGGVAAQEGIKPGV